MGLLEEAIREHLELKRKHGASDQELLQEEADALGPARREELATEHTEPAAGGDHAAAEADEHHALAHEPGSEAPESDVEQPPTAPPGEDPEAESQAHEPAEPPVPAEKSLLEDAPDFEPDTREPDRPSGEPAPPRDFDFE